MGRRWLYICLAVMLISMNIAGCSGGSTAQESAAQATTQAAAEEEPAADAQALPADARIAIAMYAGEGNRTGFMYKLLERTGTNLESAGIPAEQISVKEVENGSDQLLEAVTELMKEPANVIIVGNADQKAADEISPQITDAVVDTGAALVFFGAMPSQEEQDRWTENGWKVTCVGSDLSKVGELRAQILDSIDFDEVDGNEDHHVSVALLNTEEDSEGNQANRESIGALETYHYTVEVLNEDALEEPDGENADEETDDETPDDGDDDIEYYEEESSDDTEEDEDAPDLNELRREAAREQVIAWINDYGKDLEVILCADDALTLGAYDALEDYRQRVGHSVILLGFSPDRETLEKVASGEIAGTVFNDSLAQSKNVSDAVLAYLRGEDVPAQFMSDYVKVTVDNAQEIIDVSAVQEDEEDDEDAEGDEE